ncbi:MAG: Holliday junction branch migration protein RuvA [Bacillota bacterium]|nr:Holliday junction branch migration protein RuvA [Bacillota bacterium]
MIYALKGIVFAIEKNSVAIDVNGVVYEVLSARPEEDFSLGGEVLVYTHEVVGEDEHYLVGFKTTLEKDAFCSLIQVKGIGPKTALGALSATKPDDFFKAIQSNNTAYLKKLPGIGPKAAAQIILDLKGKLVESDSKGNPSQYDDVRQALKQMNFKVKDIDEALSKINEPGADTQQILRLALKALRKK